MVAQIGTNTNTSDVVTTPSAISVDASTAVTLLPERTDTTPFIRATIYNSGNQTLWIRNYPASQDNLKRGERLIPGQQLTLELPNMGINEYSGIYNSGGARDVFVQYI
ncbi:MAG: hypothetical protein JKY52_09310 [Flavobacteriales bacterium]|nr:hypothetical protein [Flavobacteriales bacterium]